jgi:hypothetical protein
LAAGLAWIPGVATATVYPGNDAYAGGGNNAAAITSAVLTNDATNLYVTLNLDAAANIASNNYVLYEIGLQDNGPGSGSTAVSNPYGQPIGISTGMYDWAALYLYYSGPTEISGADFYHYNGSSLAYDTGLATSFVTGPGNASVSMTFPLADLGPSGLVVGSTFKFDAWTTYGNPGGQSAYDVLDNTNAAPGYEIWNAQPWNDTPYDSATDPDSTFASTTYTVAAVPEPASLGVFCLSGVALLLRRRSAR